MPQPKNKFIRFNSINIGNAFAKEAQLITQIKQDELEQCLMLWQAKTPTLVLPAGNKWPESSTLKQALAEQYWQVLSRQTGGAPVPQSPGIINLSHIYIWPEKTPYSTVTAYENLCSVLNDFFSQYGLESGAAATPFSYCDGDYNLNINGRKIVGTAQRVILKKGGRKIVLAQAFILIDAQLDELIKPVNLCYGILGKTPLVKASAHTCLFEHIQERPSIDSIYQQLTQAFLRNTYSVDSD
ncbi:lipoate--protein ligase [Moritella sp. 5]|uniref:lipoate--protein ligase family protein n=1 Tax=Moritella sp. 5 TaxID=2746231 RepID=UPI001BA9B4A7|nr:lipoate--protein ligase [Moritella sp. 5]QUM82078.1 lipoate--protein ligase [Moritella sp. 5]